MQVNNSANFVSQAPIALGNNSSVQAQEQRARVAARETQSAEESKSQKSQLDADTRQRFDIDEQAIALIEREQPSAYGDSNNNAQQSNQQNSYSSGYDAPSNQNKLAVAAYQSVDTLAARDNIEQVFGVDLFA
ncbi:hypothetical protein [Cognaticolwellia aestuarii]|uniref:hypothetical protein n=1 Tax=Cognaticolwellia aestuarii TaxID=329993 RepID=UPI00098600B8|nr:hypothetical protein [Cognaticolwellia aestuarii]